MLGGVSTDPHHYHATPDGTEEVVHSGVAKDPVLGLMADVAAVFS